MEKQDTLILHLKPTCRLLGTISGGVRFSPLVGVGVGSAEELGNDNDCVGVTLSTVVELGTEVTGESVKSDNNMSD